MDEHGTDDGQVDETPCTVVGHIEPRVIWDRLAQEGRGPLLHCRMSTNGTATQPGDA